MMKYLCLVSLVLAVATVNSSKHKYLSTKTRYLEVSGLITPIPIPGYKPFSAMLFMRHGMFDDPTERYDNRKKTIKTVQDKCINNINENGGSVEDSVQIFLEWNVYEPKREPGLYPVSKLEIQALALRLKSMFAQLFHAYDHGKHSILIMPDVDKDKEAEVKRVEISSQVLLEALFGKPFSADTIPKCGTHDLLFMFEYARQHVDPDREKYHGTHKTKREAYENSEVVTGMIERFRKKLLLQENDVSFRVIKDFWDDCRSLRLVTQNNSVGTCPLFSERDAKIMVGHEELWWDMFVSEEYEFNGKMPCGLAFHIKALLDSNEPIVSIHGTHRSTYLLLAKIFGILRNNEERCSRIMPSMANFLAVKYTSEDPGKPAMVSFHLNERLTMITLSTGERCDFCEVGKVVETLKRYHETNGCHSLVADPADSSKDHFSTPVWKK